MTLLGSSVAQSIAGSAQAERVAARDVDRKNEPRTKSVRRGKDEFERHVTEVESDEAIEATAEQGRREEPGERGRRDPRTAHAYDATGIERPDDEKPSIDLKG